MTGGAAESLSDASIPFSSDGLGFVTRKITSSGFGGSIRIPFWGRVLLLEAAGTVLIPVFIEPANSSCERGLSKNKKKKKKNGNKVKYK